MMIFKRPGKKDEALWICFYMLPFVFLIAPDINSAAFWLFLGLVGGVFGILLFLLVRRRKRIYKWMGLAVSITIAAITGQTYGGYLQNRTLNRLEKSYYASEQLRHSVLLVNGLRQGRWIAFHQNGVVQELGHFVNDTAEGRWMYFDENGGLESEGVYKHNLRLGKWHSYYPDGGLRSIAHYLDDRMNGRWIYFHENGAMAEFGDFIDGYEERLWLSQDASKRYLNIRVYKNGKRTYEREVFQ